MHVTPGFERGYYSVVAEPFTLCGPSPRHCFFIQFWHWL
jgi:hypothetical protein